MHFFSPKEEKRESDNKIMILYYNIIYFCSLTYSSNLVRKNGCPIVPIVTPTPHKASDRPYVIKKMCGKPQPSTLGEYLSEVRKMNSSGRDDLLLFHNDVRQLYVVCHIHLAVAVHVANDLSFQRDRLCSIGHVNGQ